MRARYNLTAYSFAGITAGTTTISATHINELRTALAQAYAQVPVTAPTYTDPTLSSGATMKAAHITELRSAVIAIE